MLKFKKWIQHLVINALLFHPPPLFFVLVSVFGFIFFIGYYCAHVIDQIDIAKYKPYSSLYDNIAGIPAKNWMPEIFPVDIVYTWVNGSDPELLKNLQKFGKLKEKHHEKCPYRNCFLSPYYIVKKTYQSLQALQSADGIEILKELTDAQTDNSTSLIFSIANNKNRNGIEDLEAKINITCKNTLFWTSDSQIDGAFAWKNALLFSSGREYDDIGAQDKSKYPKECSLYYRNELGVLECNSQFRRQLHQMVNDNVASVQTWPAFLAPLKKCEEDMDNILNRYRDYEELKYSLRSVEKYMPWVRRIFIVTNGQIPHWLNLAHSRVTIVTHEEIFSDLSHLPTFSSPAIEANIYRIPGLSEHFIYFNDDVFLDAPVWPEDFYSPSDGYKIYLSWHLNDCSPGCHTSWINDHYCDDSCNTFACHYDGGDCLNASSVESDVQLDAFRLSADVCSPLCADSWLADSFCDTSCNVSSCGFDCGDCGMQSIHSHLPELGVPRTSNLTLSVPNGQLAVWFNLSHFLTESSNSVVGSFSSSAGVRKMAVNSVSQIAILVFKLNFTDSVHLQFEFGDKSQNRSTHTSFILKYNSYPEMPPTALIEMSPVKNVAFSRVAPQTLNLTTYNQLQNSANISKDIQAMLSDLKRQFDDGELTKQGFAFKKSFLIQNVSNSFSVPVVKPDTVSRPHEGKFLWERRNSFDANIHVPNAKWTGKRRLLNTFDESLQFVNRLYNDVYGFKIRKVPAHIPHFINKTLLEDLIHRYSSGFELTSSHKFRFSTDMQFSFSYYHYLMDETTTRTVSEIFSLIDTDNSGTWADRELRTFMAISKELPVYFSDLLTVHEDLKTCFKVLNVSHSVTPLYERYPDSDLPTITEQLITNCLNSSIEERLKSFQKKAAFRFKIITGQIWHMVSVSSNISEMVGKLDELRKHKRKFVCLNNDMKPGADDNDIIIALMSDFYESVLPLPSSFELTDNYRNKFLYIVDLREWKFHRNLYRALIWASLSCLLLILLLSHFKKELETTRNRWCRQKRKYRGVQSA